MKTAEQKVKSVFPNAEWRRDFIKIKSKWDWSTDSCLKDSEIFTFGIFVGNKCYAYGGKYEHVLWRRAWKKIQQEMLHILEI